LPVRPGAGRCPACGSPRIVAHDELDRLNIAHIDCDAFYAAVEKRDDPRLRDKAVIVGGGRRGVVAACCYVARIDGVRSAMPMFKALKLCPGAVVIPPDMAKYQAVGREVRALMRDLTPLVEPLSIDEAFLDLAGTEALHGGAPARSLVRLARRIEAEIGVSVSIGLSYNKFLAKIASDLDKPRGFAVIGRGEAKAFLAPRPVGLLWGAGRALCERLAADGIATIGELARYDEMTLMRRYGAIGSRLARFARGEDDRVVTPEGVAKSISAETTFEVDLAALPDLAPILWRLCEKVATRLKAADLSAGGVTLKLKTADFRLFSRSGSLADPTRLAEVLYRAALPLLEREADGRRFRLIGVGAARLAPGGAADPPDLVDGQRDRWSRLEQAMDKVRHRFGAPAIAKGRGWRPPGSTEGGGTGER
jgi:DNA polymerase-4